MTIEKQDESIVYMSDGSIGIKRLYKAHYSFNKMILENIYQICEDEESFELILCLGK